MENLKVKKSKEDKDVVLTNTYKGIECVADWIIVEVRPVKSAIKGLILPGQDSSSVKHDAVDIFIMAATPTVLNVLPTLTYNCKILTRPGAQFITMSDIKMEDGIKVALLEAHNIVGLSHK